MPVQPMQTFSTVAAVSDLSLETPSKALPSGNEFSTPATVGSSSSELSFTSSSSVSSDEQSVENNDIDAPENQAQKTIVTEHRRKELAGELLPEPLLEENPGRFVLFPIQNPEVSTRYCN